MERSGPCGTIQRREERSGSRPKRKPPCKHSNAYLTYAMDANNQIHRSLSCRHCTMIILIPAYMAILNDSSDYTRIEPCS